MKLSLNTPEELLAAVPHMFGFRPTESIVLFPLQPGLPRVRIDIPANEHERVAAWESIGGPYARNSHPGDLVAILCLTSHLDLAELGSERLRADLATLGIFSPIRLWTDDNAWSDLDSEDFGILRDETRSRIAAQMVTRGLPQPMASREAMAASLIGDRAPVARLLPAASSAADSRDGRAATEWVAERVQQFHTDGNKLADADAARMLVAVESRAIRDIVWGDIGTSTCLSHVALWSDLTRRAPDEVRAAPAALLGFASWLSGDGAKAWCALDQVPQGRDYPMANLIASAIELGLPPSRWEQGLNRIRANESVATDLTTLPPSANPSQRPAPGM